MLKILLTILTTKITVAGIYKEEGVMATDDYDYDDRHHMRRDVRDAHVNSSTARTLATV